MHARLPTSRRMLAAGGLALSIAGVASAQPPASWWERLEREARAIGRDVQRAAEAAADDVQRRADGALAALNETPRAEHGMMAYVTGTDGAPGSWVWPSPDHSFPDRCVLLVHGLDEPGTVWDDLAPQAADAGHAIVRFEYPNDAPIATGAHELIEHMRELRSRGVKRVSIVAHSMGGLVSLDALTRPEGFAGRGSGHADLPDVDRLITVGTPWSGSELARFRFVSEWREHLARWSDDPAWDRRPLLRAMRDGGGEAGRDLLPGSTFLRDLASRTPPSGVAITAIVGQLAQTEREDIDTDVRALARSSAAQTLLGPRRAAELERDAIAAYAKVGPGLGDGVVTVQSARAIESWGPAWADRVETLVLPASHRGMLQTTIIERARVALDPTSASPPDPPALAEVLARLPRADRPEGGPSNDPASSLPSSQPRSAPSE